MELNSITCFKNVKIRNQLMEMNETFNEYISIFKAFLQKNKNVYYDKIQSFKIDVNKSLSILSFNKSILIIK